MGIITKKLIARLADKLKKDEQFAKDSKALSGTVLFQDEEGCAYLSFYHGTLMEIGEGHSVYGSDYRILAVSKNWIKAFTESNKAYGIFELSGDLLDFDGNFFEFSGNAKAFYTLWQALRESYIEMNKEGVDKVEG